MVKQKILELELSITSSSIEKHLALPDKEKIFEEFFIDKKKETIKNKDLFRKRILGTISYYKGARKDLFPTSTGIVPVKVPMSDYQFTKYEAIRQIERQKERKKKINPKSKKEDNNSVNSYYRVFSRAFGNFVFPESIDRPLPGEKPTTEGEDSSESITDLEINFEDNQPQKTSNKMYELAKTNALEKLELGAKTFLTPGEENLDRYSPKFSLMLNNISKSLGPVFVYSQFRGLEGIGIFSLVLKYNGYAPFRINKSSKGIWEIEEEEGESEMPKYAFYSGTEDDEYKNLIKNIYNNDLQKLPPNIRDFIIKNKQNNLKGNVIKVLLATASAAEGISLSNVRQVHITEPYWNPVRIEQVMGRAIRLGSHIQLPLEDRHVEVFLYLASITEKQLKSSFTIKTKDLGLSSDETIFDISTRKEKITGELFSLMKESAFDCSLNSLENEPINCFSYGSKENPEDYSSVPNINKEYIDTFSIDKKEKLNVVTIRYPNKVGKLYVWNKDNNDIYDLISYQNASDKDKPKGRPIIVGKLIDKKRIEFI